MGKHSLSTRVLSWLGSSTSRPISGTGNKPNARPAARMPSQTKRLVSALRTAGFFGRGGYNVVYGPDQANRKFVAAETGPESDQLTQSERNRLIAFARQLARNSEEAEAILHQFEVNVIGTSGGKAVFDFPPDLEQAGDEVHAAFADWAASCEFFDDLSLNRVLKLALRTQILGGDLVLVFDDNLVEDSGRIIAFEPDCVGNLSESDFKRLFPDYTQTQGIIKSANGRTIGAIVSWSQRGQSEYELTDSKGRVAAWPLIKDAATPWRDSLFILHRSVGRFNQGHGSSGMWPALATLQDLTDLRGYEMQSAKKNSQTVGQIVQERQQVDGMLPPDYNPDTFVPPQGTGETPAITEDADEELEGVDFEVVRAAGAIVDAMPPGAKMELFDTKHPNNNMPQFIRWLQSSAAWSMGLGSVYATGTATASFSATQAEMLITQKTFDDEWHRLECGILDWVIGRWYQWALRKGLVPHTALPRDWMRTCVSWMRPIKREINPADEQNAINSGIKNGTITYREKLGADWKRKLKQVADEIEYCKEINFPHLANQTVSGQVIITSKKEEANIDE